MSTKNTIPTKADLEAMMPAPPRRPAMNETDLQTTLLSLIQNLLDAREEIEGEDDDIALADIARDMVSEAEGLAHADTYDGAQLLTSNKGLVLRMEDGSEFQISIVQSR